MSSFAPSLWTKEDLDALTLHVYPYLDDARKTNYMQWVGDLARGCMKVDLLRGNNTIVGSWYSTQFEPGHRADVHILPRHWSFYQHDHSVVRDEFMAKYNLRLLWAAIPLVEEAEPAHRIAQSLGFKRTGILPAFAKHNGEYVNYVYYAYLREFSEPGSTDTAEGSVVAETPTPVGAG